MFSFICRAAVFEDVNVQSVSYCLLYTSVIALSSSRKGEAVQVVRRDSEMEMYFFTACTGIRYYYYFLLSH